MEVLDGRVQMVSGRIGIQRAHIKRQSAVCVLFRVSALRLTKRLVHFYHATADTHWRLRLFVGINLRAPSFEIMIAPAFGPPDSDHTEPDHKQYDQYSYDRGPM